MPKPIILYAFRRGCHEAREACSGGFMRLHVKFGLNGKRNLFRTMKILDCMGRRGVQHSVSNPDSLIRYLLSSSSISICLSQPRTLPGLHMSLWASLLDTMAFKPRVTGMETRVCSTGFISDTFSFLVEIDFIICGGFKRHRHAIFKLVNHNQVGLNHHHERLMNSPSPRIISMIESELIITLLGSFSS